MVRKIHILSLVLFVTLAAFSGTSLGREVLLDTDALRVETIGEHQVMLFSTFRAESDEYTISGVSGRFTQSTNEMIAVGHADEPALLKKVDEDEAMSISAIDSIQIFLDDEKLIASGDVRFESDDTKATSEQLRIDTRDTIRDLLADFIDAMPEGEARDLVIQFFDRLEPDARVILLQGRVHIETEDSSLSAAWVALEESDSESFISVAHKDQPVQVRVRVSDSNELSDDSASNDSTLPEDNSGENENGEI